MEFQGIALVGIFAAALAVTVCATPVARWLAMAWRILDHPDGGRKRQRAAVPLLGGVSVLAGWFAAVAGAWYQGVAKEEPAGWLALVCSLLVLCAVGVYDDARGLRVRWKLMAQLLATLPLLAAGMTIDRLGIFGAELELGVWALPVTVLWYLLGMNAVNFIDGLDGLASVCCLCTSVVVATLSLSCDASLCGAGAAALGGALCGFLIFNFPPAKIYLGDAGSMVVGLLVSWQVLDLTSHAAEGANPLLMAGLLAVPLLDISLSIVRRALVGQCLWSPDRQHVHHRLLEKEPSVRRVLAILGTVGLMYAAMAAVGWWWRRDAAMLAAGIGLTVVLVHARIIGHGEWRVARASLTAIISRGASARNEIQIGGAKPAVIHFRVSQDRLALRERPSNLESLAANPERRKRAA